MKKIKIIYEKAYAESISCKSLIDGLVKEIKKRRISYEQTNDVKRILHKESVCIIGASYCWIEEVVKKCNAVGNVPLVLGSFLDKAVAGEYHRVCPDLDDVAKNLNFAFAEADRTRVALYGGNSMVDIDRERVDIFAKLISQEVDVYPNTGSLAYCFESFYPKAVLYDAVICVNGYAAVSLAKNLEKKNPALLKKLIIVSCEEVLKNSKYDKISLVDMNLDSYGPVSLAILEMASCREDISSITAKIKADLCKIKKKDMRDYDIEKYQLYEDPEIVSMTKIEQLFRDADDMDHHIIALLLSNAKYSDISNTCYMTEGNVKYRVKKYMNICRCKTKKELIDLLQEYLQ